MPYETIIVEKKDLIARIIFNRPERFNAINSTLADELKEALTRLEADQAVRVVIITGNPKIKEKEGRQEIKHCFSAGWDLSETAAVEPIVELLARFKKPSIAMVNGYALGGGCEIALACDFIIASETAEIGFPEINRGLLPGWGGTQRLPRRVGISRAKWLILSGDTIKGSEAEQIGLADLAVSREILDKTVVEFAAKLAAKPPLALQKIKDTINRGADKNLQEGLKLEQEALGYLLQTEDFKEGVAAFMEKRSPRWQGK